MSKDYKCKIDKMLNIVLGLQWVKDLHVVIVHSDCLQKHEWLAQSHFAPLLTHRGEAMYISLIDFSWHCTKSNDF